MRTTLTTSYNPNPSQWLAPDWIVDLGGASATVTTFTARPPKHLVTAIVPSNGDRTRPPRPRPPAISSASMTVESEVSGRAFPCHPKGSTGYPVLRSRVELDAATVEVSKVNEFKFGGEREFKVPSIPRLPLPVSVIFVVRGCSTLSKHLRPSIQLQPSTTQHCKS